jgi:uncharacterized membrane protein
MSSIAISLIVFACVFGGAVTGMLLRAFLPKDHLAADLKEVVKVGMGLVATMAADVVRTEVTPSWNHIGQVAALGAIYTL